MNNLSNSSDLYSDAKRTADAVLHRDRRRIRTLAVLTIGLWVVAGLLIPSVYLPMGAKLKKYAQMLDAANPGAASKLMVDGASEPVAAPPTMQQVPELLAQVRHQNWLISQIVFHEWMVGAIILAFALGTGFLASICTVALSLTIRRVTLRQVNDGLSGIADQLRQLQQSASNSSSNRA